MLIIACPAEKDCARKSVEKTSALCPLVQDETLKKSQSLAFRVNSDFSTVITSLDDAQNIWPSLHFCTRCNEVHLGHALFRVSPLSDFCILAQGGPRDFSNIAKCSQWPHLYMSYEATYSSKCKFIEIWPKNRFFGIRGTIFDEFSNFGP